jgi:AAA+ ATPase superfamily predicted ATPase
LIDFIVIGEYDLEKKRGNKMSLSKFIGREAELARLKGLLDNRSASLIVVRGRRRIGKSRLLSEFGKEIFKIFFYVKLNSLKSP